jgi:hypothetical protein
MRAPICAALVSLSVCMSACGGASSDNGDDEVQQSSRELKDPDREFVPGNVTPNPSVNPLKLADPDRGFVPGSVGNFAGKSGISCAGVTLPEAKICDGSADCADGSDEQDCRDDGT